MISRSHQQLFVLPSDLSIQLISADLSGASPQILHSISLPTDGSALTPTDQNLIQKWQSNSATMLLPRRWGTLKLLRIPAEAKADDTSAICLQAEMRLGRTLDQLYYDFQWLPADASQQMHAMFVSVSRERIERVQTQLSEFGLNITSAVIPQLTPRAATDSALTIADVYVSERQSDLVLSRSGVPIGAMAIPSGVESNELPAVVAANLERLQSSLAGEMSCQSVTALRVYSPHSRLFDLDAWSNSCPSVAADFVEIPQDPQLRAISLVYHALADREKRFDLLQPRKTNVGVMQKYQSPIRIAAAACLGLVLAGTHFWLEHHELSQQILRLKQKEGEFKELIDHGQQVLNTRHAVEDWQSLNQDWSTEIQEFCSFLPGTERIYLTNLQVDVSPSTGKATLNIAGLARDKTDITALDTRLVTTGNYELQPVAIHSGSTNPYYQAAFNIQAELKSADGVDSTLDES